MRKTAFILDFTSAARAEKQNPDIRIKEKTSRIHVRFLVRPQELESWTL